MNFSQTISTFSLWGLKLLELQIFQSFTLFKPQSFKSDLTVILTKHLWCRVVRVRSSFSGGQGSGAKKHVHLSSYVSPWQKAMKGDENLIATLKTSMPGPIKQKDTPKWKSFNKYTLLRSGFDKCSTEVLTNPLTCQVRHPLRRLREGQTVHEIPAAWSRGGPAGAGAGRGIPARRRLPTFLQPHTDWLDGQQRAQFHSHGGRCCALWRDRGAVNTSIFILWKSLVKTGSKSHEAWTHASALACTYTLAVEELTVNSVIDEAKCLHIKKQKHVEVMSLACTVCGCTEKKQGLDCIGGWRIKCEIVEIQFESRRWEFANLVREKRMNHVRKTDLCYSWAWCLNVTKYCLLFIIYFADHCWAS